MMKKKKYTLKIVANKCYIYKNIKHLFGTLGPLVSVVVAILDF
jgi:hypothetical protein